MNLINKLKEHWKQNKKQIIGLLILVFPSLILGFLQEWGIGFGLLAGILIYDLYLIIILGGQSITSYTHSLLPGWADKIVMLGLFCLIVKFASYGNGWGAAYWFAEGTINGHLNWES